MGVAQSPRLRRAVRRECASPILCAEPTPEEVTKKWGFEAGVFNALKSGGEGKDGASGMVKAGDLLKQYGGAYLLTSTSLAGLLWRVLPPRRQRRGRQRLAGARRHRGELRLPEYRHGEHRLRGAQGRFAHPLPADGRAHADRGEASLWQER